MSITTDLRDGQISPPGEKRVFRSNPRLEYYRIVAEPISQVDLARSLANGAEANELTRRAQRELFESGSAIGTAAESRKPEPEITAAMVRALHGELRCIKDLPISVFDVARAVYRRAKRLAVTIHKSGELVNAQTLAYINRLPELLWLLGRLIEVRVGTDATLGPNDVPGARWSRAW